MIYPTDDEIKTRIAEVRKALKTAGMELEACSAEDIGKLADLRWKVAFLAGQENSLTWINHDFED